MAKRKKQGGGYVILEGVTFPKEETPEEKAWKQASGASFPQLQALKKTIKDYSYKDKPSSLITDEKVCTLFTNSLSKTKKSLFNISDFCFSLHTGREIMPLLNMMRDEVDILSDEIKIRSCAWKDIPSEFLKKIIQTDLALLKGANKLNRDLDLIYQSVMREAKKRKRIKIGKKEQYIPREFWKGIEEKLKAERFHLKQLAILFKERESLCNIHPLTLERSFRKMQEEIREII